MFVDVELRLRLRLRLNSEYSGMTGAFSIAVSVQLRRECMVRAYY
jgi:hypothetical protein